MNTAAKRASALGVALAFTVLVVPAGTVERQTPAHAYSGIAATEAVVVTVVTPAIRTFTLPAETRAFTVDADDRTFVIRAETRTFIVT